MAFGARAGGRFGCAWIQHRQAVVAGATGRVAQGVGGGEGKASATSGSTGLALEWTWVNTKGLWFLALHPHFRGGAILVVKAHTLGLGRHLVNSGTADTLFGRRAGGPDARLRRLIKGQGAAYEQSRSFKPLVFWLAFTASATGRRPRRHGHRIWPGPEPEPAAPRNPAATPGAHHQLGFASGAAPQISSVVAQSPGPTEAHGSHTYQSVASATAWFNMQAWRLECAHGQARIS